MQKSGKFPECCRLFSAISLVCVLGQFVNQSFEQIWGRQNTKFAWRGILTKRVCVCVSRFHCHRFSQMKKMKSSKRRAKKWNIQSVKREQTNFINYNSKKEREEEDKWKPGFFSSNKDCNGSKMSRKCFTFEGQTCELWNDGDLGENCENS